MISINLNALREWERVRSNTEPQTPDVERQPGADQSNRPEIDDGAHGLAIDRRRRRRRASPDGGTARQWYDENEAYEVDVGDEPEGYGPPADGEHAPLEPYQATRVDEDA